MHKIYFPNTSGFSLDMGAQSKELELEPVKFEEVDSTYLGNFPPYNSLVLSAITSTKAKLHRTMSAFMRSLNKSLSGTEIKAGQKAEFYDDGGQSLEQVGVLLSKPRKAGLFAVMTAQIPCSDGQSISIVFYAPDEDPLKITNDDTLVAFRFLLNKRDITHKVAPNQGKDISLAQTTQALANLLERNSAKFRANLNKAMADRKEHADKQDELERLQDELTRTLASISDVKGVNTELISRKDKLKVERDQAEKRFTGLQAKINDFKPVEPEDWVKSALSKTYNPDEPYSAQNSVAGIKKYADQHGVIVAKVEKTAPDFEGIFNNGLARVTLEKHDSVIHMQIADDGKMAVFSKEGKRINSFGRRSFFDQYSNDAGTLKERIKAFSVGADEAANDTEKPSLEEIHALITEYKDKVVGLANELYQAHKGQGIGNNAPTPEKVSDALRDILGDMNKRAGRENVEANGYGKDLYEAFMSLTAGEAYEHLRKSWANERPELSFYIANDEDIARGHEILKDLDKLEDLLALAADKGNARSLEALKEIAENLDFQHPKARAFYDSVGVSLKRLSEYSSSNMSPAMAELKKNITYCLGARGEQLAEYLRVAINSLNKANAEQEKQKPEVEELPEDLKRHLETLDKLAAGGFIVEEAVEQLSEVSEYLENGAYWDYYGEKFNTAADLVADAIEARLEVSENDE
ncbi:hypothetical protein [Vibrio europaeus]|uniref:defense against restriction DarA-related protein n=1 Tax=Vibrio europaeus TaxID=300876 RepID=UPI00233EF468|nr:hypothetical protein [Vibrio europaeus]MDC5753531.1 hypothetical protein [Vibrio europaeus]MDC5816556.1 hypothetical protein [Vibrio europaeus]